MSNEYLEKLPTTEGNRQTWTWSAWIKRNEIAHWARIWTCQESQVGIRGSGEDFVRFRDENSSPAMDLCSGTKLRDTTGWMHVVCVMNSTAPNSEQRGRMYINGKRIEEWSTEVYPTWNAEGAMNNNIWHRIAGRVNSSEFYTGALQDIYFVDGLALDAAAFGFNKQGEGSISIGSSSASDIVRGSWRPKSPSTIKAEVNRKGGFGTNGYYLPMNDKKMVGADHRIEIDSILKLNQDLQQPKVGIATTSAAGIGHTDVVRDIAASKNYTGLNWDGCVAFDGDSDYINCGDSADFHLDGDFTIECWIYKKNSGATNSIINQWTNSASTRSFLFQVHGTNNLSFHWLYDPSQSAVSMTSPDHEFPVGKWTHVAVTRSSNTYYLFQDGYRVDAETSSNAPQNSSADVEIGRNADGGSEYVNGFISNLRIVKGTALYTAATAGKAFDPPTTALTNITNTKLLCCQSSTDANAAAVAPNTLSRQGTTFATTNEITGSLVIALPLYQGATSSGFGDYSAYVRGPQGGPVKTITVGGNVAMGNTDSWYGSAPKFANNAKNDILSSSGTGAGTPFDLGNNNFTLEFWARCSGNGSDSTFQTIFDCRTSDSSTTGFAIGFNDPSDANGGGTSDGHQDIKLYGIPAGTGTVTPGNPLGTHTWNHFCVERKYNPIVDANNRGTITVYSNGAPVGVYTGWGATADYTEGGFRIGAANAGVSGDWNFYGSVQDFRLYNGIAKYDGKGFKVANHYNCAQGIQTYRCNPDNTANNFCTLSGIQTNSPSTILSSGALRVDSGASSGVAYGTVGFPTTGKWFYEAIVDERGTYNHLGVQAEALPEYTTSHRCLMRDDGNVYGGSGGSYLGNTGWTAQSVGDVVGVGVDADAGKMYLWKNGGSQSGPWDLYNFGFANPKGCDSYRPYFLGSDGTGMTFNFGQDCTFRGQKTGTFNKDANGIGEFSYSVPTGYKALCASNFPEPQVKDPSLHFQNILYQGTAEASKEVSGLKFKPDFAIVFNRQITHPRSVYDVIRGGNQQQNINEPDATVTRAPFGLAFTDDGFSASTGGNSNNGNAYVAHCWKAGGPAVPNNDGSVVSMVSVNQDAGFSIIRAYAQTSGSITLGHGLNKPPVFWFYTPYTGGTNWYIYHKSLGAEAWLQPDNSTAATTGNNAAWAVSPTDTILTHGSGFVNQKDIIFYAWTEIPGYSSFGEYEGNGNSWGPVIITGFKPALVIIKSVDFVDDWTVFDNVRDDKNPNDNIYYLNTDGDENLDDTTHGIDFLSNGFKCRGTSNQENKDGGRIIYMAWAESPFKYAQAK